MPGHDIEVADFCPDKRHPVGTAHDSKGKAAISDDGIESEHPFRKADADTLNIFHEKIVGVWTKKHVTDEIVIKDGKSTENDTASHCHVDAPSTKSEVKACNGENGDEEPNSACLCANVFPWMVIPVNSPVEC